MEKLNDFDYYLINEGKHFDLSKKLGAIVQAQGVHFSLWAPNAKSVSVIGDFNHWDKEKNLLIPSPSGVWSTFIPALKKGARYKFFIQSNFQNYAVEKADPMAKYSEVRPSKASVVWQDDYQWQDQTFLKNRHQKSANLFTLCTESIVSTERSPMLMGHPFDRVESVDSILRGAN